MISCEAVRNLVEEVLYANLHDLTDEEIEHLSYQIVDRLEDKGMFDEPSDDYFTEPDEA